MLLTNRLKLGAAGNPQTGDKRLKTRSGVNCAQIIFDFSFFFCYNLTFVTSPGSQNRYPRSTLGQIGPYLGIGLEFALYLLIFFFLGYYLDGRWGTAPWLMLAGAVVGFVGGFYSLFKTLGRLSSPKPKGRTGAE